MNNSRGEKVSWVQISVFTLLFLSILFLDMVFIFYFMFNFFFVMNETPENSFCLFDSYVGFLDSHVLPNVQETCDGFFLNQSQYDECHSFGALENYCQFIFIASYNDYEKCDDLEDEVFLNECYDSYLNFETDPYVLGIENEEYGVPDEYENF